MPVATPATLPDKPRAEVPASRAVVYVRITQRGTLVQGPTEDVASLAGLADVYEITPVTIALAITPRRP